MGILYSLGASGLLFVVSLVLLAIRPRFFAIPWMGMVIVVLGTTLSFNVSAHLAAGGHDGVGIGPLFAMMIGFLGVGVIVASVRLQAMSFVPLGAIVTGVVYISSFYAYILPHLNPDFLGNLLFALPGFMLAAYGGYLWYRNGLAGLMEHRSILLLLFIALVIVAGLGVLGLFQFERFATSATKSRLLAHPPDLHRIAAESPLVVEGEIVNRDSFKYKSEETRKTIRYGLYTMKVTHFWRGTGPQMIHFAVRDYSPVEMAVGQPYLIFASGRADPEQLPGHWSADFPTHVWTPRADHFFPFPGLPRDEPISHDLLESFLESQRYIGE